MRFANPKQNRRGRFLKPNREARVSYSNHGKERGYLNPHEYKMKVDIPSFSGNLDIEFFLDWIYDVDKFFVMAYVSMEKQGKFVAYKLKGGGATW